MKRMPMFIALAAALSFPAFANEQAHGDKASSASSASAQGAGQQQDEQTIKQVQEKLAAEGHEVQADGKLGPKTQAALKEFQQSKGLEASGQLDQETLAALQVGGEQSAATGGSAKSSEKSQDSEKKY